VNGKAPSSWPGALTTRDAGLAVATASVGSGLAAEACGESLEAILAEWDTVAPRLVFRGSELLAGGLPT
jgi:hypothetical protein